MVEVTAACHTRKIIPSALMGTPPKLDILSEIIFKMVIVHLEYLTLSNSFVMVR